MKQYKAIVKDSKNGARRIISSENNNKQEFIEDLRGNGYKVNASKVMLAKTFDNIMNHPHSVAYFKLND
jgi:DNA-binding winged helix-turn-helix (wHTH) protein